MALTGVLSCTSARRAVIWPDKAWPTAAPESQGLDSSVLAKAVETIRRENINIHSILLIRNGYAVLDAIFYPYDGRRPHDVASVTKSITATLTGLAVEEGFLPPMDTPVADIFSPMTVGIPPAGWQEVTLEHLVTMSSGLQCGDPPEEATIFLLRNSTDWVKTALALPVEEAPGKRFDYCSPNFHILSAAISGASGMSLADFAYDRLFKPLGIVNFVWPSDPQGVNVGWGDLRLYPADMARVGYLYLNNGRWKGRRVLPSGWVKAATRPRLSTPDRGADYGYGWWLAKDDFKGVYEARGRGGQNITVWPRKNILLVTTGGGFDRDRVIELLLPSVLSDSPLPENPSSQASLRAAAAEAAGPPQPVPVGDLPDAASRVSGRWFVMEENNLGLERLLLAFREGDSEASLTALVAGKEFDFPVGLDGVYRFSGISPSGDPAALKGRWEAEDRFVLDYNEITRVNRFRMELTFTGDGVTLDFSEPTGQIMGRVKGSMEPHLAF